MTALACMRPIAESQKFSENGGVKSLFFLALVGLAGCQPQGLQPQRHFREALENTSMSPSLVRIGLIRDDKVEPTCVFARNLLLAIAIERDPEPKGVSKEDFDVALAQQDHRFTFKRPEALRELGLDSNVAARRKACELIASGKQAMRADYTGDIVEGVWRSAN